jgi:succinate dehydrogenase / fumarate reductase, cytochrome b subunit
MTTHFGSSVGRKLVVGISGLFLVLFLVVHLSVNLTLFAGSDTYNSVAHWMATNPAVVAMRPVLALGLLVHVLVTLHLALTNWRSRPQRYAVNEPSGSSTWASRHMVVLGGLVLLFLALHLSSFSIRMTFGAPPMTEVAGVAMKDAYALVTARFGLWWYVALYAAAMVLLGLHLSHGFQSAIQTLGGSNRLWRSRWTVVGNVYAVIIAVGFASLPVYFLLQSQWSAGS